MKIGFFGGCFNPPTNAHIGLAEELIEEKIVDKVIFVPVGDFYKKESLASAKDRYKMLELAIQDKDKIDIDDIEIYEEKQLFASDVFKRIDEKYLKDDKVFILGSDNFLKMKTWKNYDRIIDHYKYVVIMRNNDIVETNRENIRIYRPKNLFKYDSTLVRSLIVKNKMEVSKYIDKKVYDYILKNNLYLKN